MNIGIGPIADHFPCTTLRVHQIAFHASDQHAHAIPCFIDSSDKTPQMQGAVVWALSIARLFRLTKRMT
jgi:hypothetical protein